MAGPALLRAIYDRPKDDAVRLVYADWLDDHGEPERAEFIRVQCELEPVRRRYEDERVVSLHTREWDLLIKLQQSWQGEISALLGQPLYEANVTCRRGFPDTIALPVQWYLEHGAAIHRLFPLLRRVQLYRVAGWGERLAQFPIPAGVEELEVPCWITGADAEAITASAHLRHLPRLHLWLGNRDDETADEAVCRALVPCADWPRLTELRLTAVSEDPEECRPAFNVLAGAVRRPVAVFVNPWSRPFVFAPRGGFARYFPGRLPNGEQTFAIWPEDHSNQWPPEDRRYVVLLRFDPEGNPLGEREIALPEDCFFAAYRGREGGEKELDRRRGALLRETVGHRPALIRVKELQFRGQWMVGNFAYCYEEEMGWPDDPDQLPEEDSLRGAGGFGAGLHNWISTGSFRFSGTSGYEWWVDESGQVTAT